MSDDPKPRAGDGGRAETEALVRRTLQTPEPDADFRASLRAQLLAEHPAPAPAPATPRRRWLRRPLGIAAGCGAIAISAAATVAYVVRGGGSGPRPVAVAVVSALQGSASVRPGSPIVLRFSRPLDPRSVAAAASLSPAAQIRVTTDGARTVVTPLRPLASNTAYLLTLARGRVRTADGHPVTADLHVAFGTATFVAAGTGHPGGLPLEIATPAAAGSEAVFTQDGALLATGARTGAGGAPSVALLGTSGTATLAPATDAICVSRSGRSIAYLLPDGQRRLVLAAGDGHTVARLAVAIDAGSPLGWIDDAEVSFVGGGRLRAVDRDGRIRTLFDGRVDARRDTIAISPGGRYVFLRPAAASATGDGVLLDLVGGRQLRLPGIVGDPAFSADGATIAWIDGRAGTPTLAVRAAGGVVVNETRLPDARGATISDLAISPDERTAVYTLTRPTGASELRLASFPGGATLAVVPGGGASPNWAASGDRVAVQTGSGAGAAIAIAHTTAAAGDLLHAAERAAIFFARAQESRDPGAAALLSGDAVSSAALRAATSGLALAPTRASIVQTLVDSPTTATVHIRLFADSTPGHPAVRAADETLRVRRSGGRVAAVVDGVEVGRFADLTPGPHLVRIDSDDAPGQVLLTFDGELDPATVSGAITATIDGRAVALRTSYTVAARTVRILPVDPVAGRLRLRIATRLHDIDGTPIARPLDVAADLARR